MDRQPEPQIHAKGERQSALISSLSGVEWKRRWSSRALFTEARHLKRVLGLYIKSEAGLWQAEVTLRLPPLDLDTGTDTEPGLAQPRCLQDTLICL